MSTGVGVVVVYGEGVVVGGSSVVLGAGVVLRSCINSSNKSQGIKHIPSGGIHLHPDNPFGQVDSVVVVGGSVDFETP